MKKALLFLGIAVICAGFAFHYFRPDFSLLADTSDGENGPIADMDQPLPHALLPSVGSGGWIDLSAYKGQVVLIAFWTTWCPGCVDEVPDLISLQEQFSPKGFTVVAVAVDDQGEESVESFVRKRTFTANGASASIIHPVFLSSDETARKLGFEGGLPAGLLVNREGREVKIIRGAVSESVLAKAIQRLLKD